MSSRPAKAPSRPRKEGTPVPRTVAIGASAGGLQALQAFFEEVPEQTELAFVVVVHLSPDHESHLSDVLQRHTEMPVAKVTGRTQIEAGHVYVVPPDRRLTVKEGVLDLHPFERPEQRRHAIDLFFRAHAEGQGDGVGVILSGSGTDGAVGIKDVKESGGLVFVQAPEEAGHDGMPRAAIASGVVDFVLPVREMAQRIVAYGRNAAQYPLGKPDVMPDPEAEALLGILAVIQVRTGHNFSGYKRSSLLRRISKRMLALDCKRLADYQAVLKADPEEAHALLPNLLISVTNFFRDREAFAVLEREVIPALFEGRGARDMLRVWSVGCASGEEAYSLAILLAEQAARMPSPPQFQVFASDIAEAPLALARAGLYPEAIAEDVTEERLGRFFTPEGTQYRVRPELRERVLFAPHNLLKDPPFSRIDLVVCRNVLIYLDRTAQEQAFDLFYYAGRPGGTLFLGNAESAEEVSALFEPVDKRQRIYRRRGSDGPPARLPAMTASRLPVTARVDVDETPPVRASVLAGELHLSLLEHHGPPSVVVNDQGGIVHLSESAGRFLVHPGGSPTNNLLRLVRPELRVALRVALYEAFEHGRATGMPVRRVMIGDTAQSVHVIVRPGPEEDGKRALALVMFSEMVGDPYADGVAAIPGADVQGLEHELSSTRERLRLSIEEYETSNEELKASNEELQSMNEELKSTLEELETGKEELQSVNEELQSINQELKAKVDELGEVNSDLFNLMASTEIGTLFLDRQLCVKRFTPRTTELFNLIASDHGRPFAHVTHLLGDVPLVEDARAVLDSLVPVKREIQCPDGRWFLMHVRPYRTLTDRIDGVVFTFVEMTDEKRAEQALQQSEERLRLAMEAGGLGAWDFDLDTGVVRVSPEHNRIVGLSSAQTTLTTEAFLEIVCEADRPHMAAALAGAAEKGTDLDIQFRVEKPGTARTHWISALAQVYRDEAGVPRRLTGVVQDVTARHEYEATMQQLNEVLRGRVAERTQQVRDLATTLTLAEQQERHRIAHVLHDHLQQVLYGLQAHVKLIERSPLDGTRATDQSVRMNKLLDEAIRATRTLTMDLSPPALADESLSVLIEWLGLRMRGLHDLRVDVVSPVPVMVQAEDVRVLLFQLVRELLFNIAKHAGVKQARVVISETPTEINVQVEDEGRGFDVAQAERERPLDGGFGLFTIRERLRLLGGRLVINSTLSVGTTVSVSIPKADKVPLTTPLVSGRVSSNL